MLLFYFPYMRYFLVSLCVIFGVKFHLNLLYTCFRMVSIGVKAENINKYYL